MSESSAQTVVIGAGVVGLACAAALARSGREVFVLERDNAIGQGISSRNSEVIHAGIYYTPGSLKAQLCIRGRELLYDYARDRHINASAIGKLIVATNESEVLKLDMLAARASQNGVDDLQKIDGPAAIAMQPGLHCLSALHSPSTGIIDSHALMVSLVADIEQHGGAVVCRAPVEHLSTSSADTSAQGKLRVAVGGSDPMLLVCDEVINSGGLSAVALARATTGLKAESIPRARFAKGNYFRLQGRAPFTMLIYPAPVDGGLGVHLTLDHGSQARFGPDVQWLNDKTIVDVNGPEFNYEVDPGRANSFYSAIRSYWPDLPDDALLPDYSGVRPKAVYSEASDVDFNISTPADHGVAGLVNLFGIESPGLTSSLAIAERVTQALDNQY